MSVSQSADNTFVWGAVRYGIQVYLQFTRGRVKMITKNEMHTIFTKLSVLLCKQGIPAFVVIVVNVVSM